MLNWLRNIWRRFKHWRYLHSREYELECKRQTRRRRQHWKHARYLGKRRREHKQKLGVRQERVGMDMKPIRGIWMRLS